MYLELKKKIREYKNNSGSYQVEPQNVKKIKLWDYDISLPADSHPFLPTYLSVEHYDLESSDRNPIPTPSDRNPIPTPSDRNPTRVDPDPFDKECYGNKGVLASILSAEHVDSDWLNGVLLAQELISEAAFNQFSFSINTWHSGYQSGLVRGFNHFCSASKYAGHKKIQWDWLGIDVKDEKQRNEKTKHILTGAVGTNDIGIGSNLVNAASVVKEKWADGADIIFHDIYPDTPNIMLSGVVASIMFMSNRGYLVCRLPDSDKWGTITVNIMLMLAMIYKKVNIWCPMWGRAKRTGRRKIYLIAREKKRTVYKSNYRIFINLLKDEWGKDNKQFLKKAVHDDDKVKEWVGVCQNIREEIEGATDVENLVSEWTELLTNNLTMLPKNKKI